MAKRSNRIAARARRRPARPLREKRGCWTSYRHDGRTALGAGIQHDQDDQDLPAALLHLVERHHVRHPIVDLGLWRIGRDRRVRQSLLPNPRRQDRPDAPVRAPLFFLHDTAPTEIYTLSLHDALPISARARVCPSTIAPAASVGPSTPSVARA